MKKKDILYIVLLLVELAILYIPKSIFLRGDLENNQDNPSVDDTIKDENLPAVHPDLSDILESYPDFKEFMKESAGTVPIVDTMIPQGIALVRKYIFITAYDNKKVENSKCFIIEKGNLKKTVDLDTKSHVGAIDYDERNDLIWIPGKEGKLEAYGPSDFLEKDRIKPKYVFENLSDELLDFQNKRKKNIDYLTIDGNYLYIGNFSVSQKGTVKKYEILKDDQTGLKLHFIKLFKVPPQVQGIAFYEKNQKKYMILSSSYGRANPSRLHFYEYDEKIEDYSIVQHFSFELSPMLEQVTVARDNLYIIFESPALKYSNCREKVENICVLDLLKILDKIGDK